MGRPTSFTSHLKSFNVTDLRRYSLAAVVLLIVLRIGIGWQLLYEGLWKIDTLDSPKPWTSAGYLKNSVGPLRDQFRELAGDPDELGWLNYDKVSARWIDWADRFKKHYELDAKQAGSLNRLLNGSQTKVGDREVFVQDLKSLPEGIDSALLAKTVNPKIFAYDAKEKKLMVDAGRLLQPNEKAKLDKLVEGREDAEAQQWLSALNTLYTRQKNGMGYLKKLKATIKGDPKMRSDEKWQKVGKVQQYKERLADYERDYAAASTPFEFDHLSHTWGKIQTLRTELTGPVKALEAEFYDTATKKILRVEQHSEGEMSKPWTALRISDTLTILGLTVLGAMLIAGLFTRFAAVAAALMLFGFYMAMPPWPGVPEIPGPEHSFIVNKNLIEVFALLALATVPSGMWFGLDRALSVFFANWKADSKITKSRHSVIATGDEPEAAPAT